MKGKKRNVRVALNHWLLQWVLCQWTRGLLRDAGSRRFGAPVYREGHRIALFSLFAFVYLGRFARNLSSTGRFLRSERDLASDCRKNWSILPEAEDAASALVKTLRVRVFVLLLDKSLRPLRQLTSTFIFCIYHSHINYSNHIYFLNILNLQ